MGEQRKERRNAIRALLRDHRVSSQEELGELLGKRGFEVTQATLSRDLAKLNARRTTLPEGGSVYELNELKAPAGEDALKGLRQLVLNVESNLSLVVVKTSPGAASAVALGIDRARLSSVLGTIAGDDTIFIAPVQKVSASALAKQLKLLWRQEDL